MKPKSTSKKDALVDAMNELAKKMLEGGALAGVQNQIDVFTAVTKWIAVKNRLNLADEAEGSKINAYRDALEDTPAVGAIQRTHSARKPDRNTFRNVDVRERATSLSARGRRRTDRSSGGAELEALKRRLPDANGGGAVGDRDDAVRTDE
jgi:hypothetical protein